MLSRPTVKNLKFIQRRLSLVYNELFSVRVAVEKWFSWDVNVWTLKTVFLSFVQNRFCKVKFSDPCFKHSSNTGYYIFKHGFKITKHVRASYRHVILGRSCNYRLKLIVVLTIGEYLLQDSAIKAGQLATVSHRVSQVSVACGALGFVIDVVVTDLD